MAKWQQRGSTGISIGGEWYGADESGIVDVPDNVGGLGEYGFKPYVDPAIIAEDEAAAKREQEEIERAAKDAADKIAQAEAEAAKKAEDEAAAAKLETEAEKSGKKGGK